MSKCKAVLDGDKITEIRVKTKAQKEKQKSGSETKNPKQSTKSSWKTERSE